MYNLQRVERLKTISMPQIHFRKRNMLYAQAVLKNAKFFYQNIFLL